jgi:hypothetical protein
VALASPLRPTFRLWFKFSVLSSVDVDIGHRIIIENFYQMRNRRFCDLNSTMRRINCNYLFF